MGNEHPHIDYFAALANHSIEVICRHAPDGTYKFASESIYKYTGYKPSELMGENAFDYIHPDDAELMRRYRDRSFESEENLKPVRYRFRTKSGEYIWLETTSKLIRSSTAELYQPTSETKKHNESSSNDTASNDVMEIITISRDISEHIRQEEQLKNSENHFRALVENIPGHILVVDKEGDLLFRNKGSLELGIPENNSNSFYDLIKKDADRVRKIHQQIFKTGRPDTYECRFTQIKTSEDRWFSCNVFLLKNIDGVSDRLVISARNRNKLKTEQLAIKESEQRFRQLVENASDSIYRCDYNGNFLYMNPVALQVTGYSTEDIQNLNIADIIHPDYKDSILRFYNEQFQKRIESSYLELPILTKNQETIWFGQNVQMIMDGNYIIGFQGVARDISKRKMVEEALIKSEARNSALLNALPDIVFRLSASGRVLDYRPGKPRNILQNSTVLHQYIQDFIHDNKTAQAIIEGIEKAIATNEGQNIEFSTQDKDDQKELFFEARIVRSSTKEAICIVRDITERKEAEQQIISARQDAENSSKAKEQFISVMSHEIRTPLNAVIGLANLLKDTNLNDEQLEYLNGIKYSGDNLLKIVNDILDYSKIESNKLQLEKTDFNLKELIRNSLKTSRISANKEQISVRLDIDDKIPDTLTGDPVRINQTINNLLSNAFKFTTSGEIAIELTLLEETKKHYNIHFVVQDSGIGISNDQIEGIFDSFTQAAPEITRKFGGTGLGLTITKQLIELHGGTITVESEPNKGTTFKFDILFDKSKEGASGKKEKPSVTNANLKGLSILVAEDNEMNQLVLSRYLAKWNIEYDIVNNGIGVLKKLEKHTYDMVFLDLEMPVMDGYTVLSHIRGDLNISKEELPVVAISASATTETVRRVKEMGANEFITKPIDPDEFLKKILNLTSNLKHLPNFLKEGTQQTETQLKFSLIDLTYLMESSLNDKAYVSKMIHMFLKNTPQYIKDLKKLYHEGDMEELRKTAHKFKASINIMGIKSAGKVIKKLEENIEESKGLDSLAPLISSIEFYSLASCAELEVILKSNDFADTNNDN